MKDSRSLSTLPCARCGYQLQGIPIDTARAASAAEWKAICPECGHDNFGPLPLEARPVPRFIRQWRWVIRVLTVLLVLGGLWVGWWLVFKP